jgi:hypothetical protein
LTTAITTLPHHSRLHRRRILPRGFQAVLLGSRSFLCSILCFLQHGA